MPSSNSYPFAGHGELHLRRREFSGKEDFRAGLAHRVRYVMSLTKCRFRHLTTVKVSGLSRLSYNAHRIYGTIALYHTDSFSNISPGTFASRSSSESRGFNGVPESLCTIYLFRLLRFLHITLFTSTAENTIAHFEYIHTKTVEYYR